MLRFASVLSLTFLVAPLALQAEVTDSSAHGFTSRHRATVPAPPTEVYAKLVDAVGLWWSSDHTFSGDAGNLRIDPREGGCFCETLPNGGSVRHLMVVHADPGRLLRLRGGLGPLQAEAVAGSLSWELAPSNGGTSVSVTYAVGGYVSGGLDAWAAGVDGVVGEQLGRFARFVSTGDPEESDRADGSDR